MSSSKTCWQNSPAPIKTYILTSQSYKILKCFLYSFPADSGPRGATQAKKDDSDDVDLFGSDDDDEEEEVCYNPTNL